MDKSEYVVKKKSSMREQGAKLKLSWHDLSFKVKVKHTKEEMEKNNDGQK